MSCAWHRASALSCWQINAGHDLLQPSSYVHLPVKLTWWVLDHAALLLVQVIPELKDDLLDLFRRRMEHNLKYARPEDRKHWYGPPHRPRLCCSGMRAGREALCLGSLRCTHEAGQRRQRAVTPCWRGGSAWLNEQGNHGLQVSVLRLSHGVAMPGRTCLLERPC